MKHSNAKTGKIKVLYLPRWYPNRYDPMEGLFIERHARSVSIHCQVVVLYVHQDENVRRRESEIIRDKDDEIYQIRIYYAASHSKLPLCGQLTNLFRFFLAHRKGFGLLKKEGFRPDVIHVNVLTRVGIIALLCKWFTGIPYIITEHWTRYLPGMTNYHGSLRKFMTRLVVKSAAAVLPVTENLRKAMESHGLINSKYIIIPNVVDTDFFRPGPRISSGSRKKFIHISCFEDKQKNISGILHVLKKLSGQRQDWECHLIGEGIHYDHLKQMSDQLGLTDKFAIFHGLKENVELVKLIQDACFQLLFSRFENLPVVILEGYACGIPILSTDVGGISEHVNPELGILISSEDKDGLLDRLNFMLDRWGNFDRKKIRAYAIENFSKEVIGRRLFEVYRETLRVSENEHPEGLRK